MKRICTLVAVTVALAAPAQPERPPSSGTVSPGSDLAQARHAVRAEGRHLHDRRHRQGVDPQLRVEGPALDGHHDAGFAG